MVKYGAVPSAAALARDFNLRARDGNLISDETARRWLRGLSLPNLPRMRVLAEWLGFDPLEAAAATARPHEGHTLENQLLDVILHLGPREREMVLRFALDLQRLRSGH